MNAKPLVLGLLLLTPGLASALTDTDYESYRERRLERLSSELQLSADQKAKLEAIYNEKHEKIRAIREEAQNRIRELLTEEQLSKWNQLKK